MGAVQPMMTGRALQFMDGLSLPGSMHRANEDRWGLRADVAWVIDGATGLGDEPLLDAPSDAAWLATAANDAIARAVGDGESEPAAILASAAAEVAERFRSERRRAPRHRYEIPTAAVLVASFAAGEVAVAEMGDCRIYLSEGGTVRGCGGMAAGREIERRNAREVATGDADLRSPAVLERLRQIRNIANTPSGYWVFGPDPEPVRHARLHRLPAEGDLVALLATDGFDALVADYERFDEDGVIAAALEDGLPQMGQTLRHIERIEDPRRRIYPRFKVSDDATALLVRYAG